MRIKLLAILVVFSFVNLFSQVINKNIKDALNIITVKEVKSHILFLSDDLLMGRKSGAHGNEVAARYIASQFESAGLKPVIDNGKSFFQPMNLIGIQMDHDMTLSVKGKYGSEDFIYYKNFIGFSELNSNLISIKDAEMIFVGFGIDAPEYKWNDFKGIDVKGKILLVMNSDPEDDPKIFEGNKRTYYGRWTYKYEEAARKGALGVIIIHTNKSAAYGWNVVQSSWSGEEFSLEDNKDPKLNLQGWLTEESSKKLVKLGGYDLQQLTSSALKKEFIPVPLNVKISIEMKNKIRKIETRNVIGLLEGSDKNLRNQYVVFTSHFDHLGTGEIIKGDSIYNGAFDNATGVSSMISIAKSISSSKIRPKRSILFIATAAEEEGTLGSEYFCQNPPVAPSKIIACLNIDAVNIWGIAKNVEVIGGRYSNLLEITNSIAKEFNMYAVDDQEPNAGSFYRSDQWPFAKLGIPSVYYSNGTDFEGKPLDWGKKQSDKFLVEDYHQPSDEVKDWWNYDGLIKNTQLYALITIKLANDSVIPKWKKGTKFKQKKRK